MYSATPMKCSFFRDITYAMDSVYVEVQHSVDQILNICWSAQNFYLGSTANIFESIRMFDSYMFSDFVL